MGLYSQNLGLGICSARYFFVDSASSCHGRLLPHTYHYDNLIITLVIDVLHTYITVHYLDFLPSLSREMDYVSAKLRTEHSASHLSKNAQKHTYHPKPQQLFSAVCPLPASFSGCLSPPSTKNHTQKIMLVRWWCQNAPNAAVP